MTVTAPPRPPRPSDPVDREELEALVEALIEEARKRAQRRRRRNGAVVTLVALVGVALFAVFGRSAQSQSASPALAARSNLPAGPTSSRIAFAQSMFGGQASGGLYVVNADGSRKRRLTSTAWHQTPAWSPDGRKIAFVSNWQIYVMNADGSGQRRLTRNGARNFAPAWSPDGQRIAFERRLGRQKYGRCSGCGKASIFEVYVMNANGSGQRRLTQRGAQPRWSPDGRKIAFVSERDGNAEIYVMNADGSAQRNLTRNPAVGDCCFAWSPAAKR